MRWFTKTDKYQVWQVNAMPRQFPNCIYDHCNSDCIDRIFWHTVSNIGQLCTVRESMPGPNASIQFSPLISLGSVATSCLQDFPWVTASGGRYSGFLIEWIFYWIESSQIKILNQFFSWIFREKDCSIIFWIEYS